jgi:hypothetical protein
MALTHQSTVPDAPEDGLERLMELARQASPVNRLRLERTIKIIVEARQVVFNARQTKQEWVARLKTELQIMRDRSRA